MGAAAVASGGSATAIGDQSFATGDNSTALGSGANASAANSTAIGFNSTNTRVNTVSVGSAANARQVTNVAAGTQANDAVNLGQMQAGDAATLASANAFTTNAVNNLNTVVQGEFAVQDKRISRIGAMGTAMSMMTSSASGIQSPNRLAVGYGHQSGENAVSIGYQRLVKANTTFTIGGSFANGESSVGAGLGVGW